MGLTDKALSILNVLGQYTLEAIIVHVLGALPCLINSIGGNYHT